jgi:hypothetical protein
MATTQTNKGANGMNIVTEIIDGNTCYLVDTSKVAYCLYFMKTSGQWGLSSKRKALSNRFPGSFRYFAELTEIEDSIKALRGISLFIAPKTVAVSA